MVLRERFGLLFIFLLSIASVASAAEEASWKPFFTPTISKETLLASLKQQQARREARLEMPLFSAPSEKLVSMSAAVSEAFSRQPVYTLELYLTDEGEAIRRFRQLRALQEMSTRDLLGELRVPMGLALQGNRISMDLIEGKSLAELIKKSSVDSKAAALYRRYSKILFGVEKRLRRTASPFRVTEGSSLRGIEEALNCSNLFTTREPIRARVLEVQGHFEGGAIYVLRPENIIVESKTGHMYLVNPL